MAYRLEWSQAAIEDLESIALYVARDSSVYAAAVVKAILNITRNLSRFPFAGRVVPEMDDDNIREMFVYSYRVIYRTRGRIITVASIVHGRRILDLK